LRFQAALVGSGWRRGARPGRRRSGWVFLPREERVVIWIVVVNGVRGAFYDCDGCGCDIVEVGVFVPVPPRACHRVQDLIVLVLQIVG